MKKEKKTNKSNDRSEEPEAPQQVTTNNTTDTAISATAPEAIVAFHPQLAPHIYPTMIHPNNFQYFY